MRLKSLIPVLILGGVLATLVFTARYTQRRMHEYETQTVPAAAPADTSATAPAADPNSSPSELVEGERLKEQFPDTLVNTWGIRFKVLREGTGSRPIAGDRITANYEGRLLDGTVFDSSYATGRPIKFRLMSGQVIRGWDYAFVDMHKGEKRLVVIPYRLAYGESGRPPKIPPRAALVFEVELVDFEGTP